MTLPDLIKPFPGDHCILCGDKPSYIGIYQPGDSQHWGAAVRKSRFVRYCLCVTCKDKKETPVNVEKVLWSELAGGVTNVY